MNINFEFNDKNQLVLVENENSKKSVYFCVLHQFYETALLIPNGSTLPNDKSSQISWQNLIGKYQPIIAEENVTLIAPDECKQFFSSVSRSRIGDKREQWRFLGYQLYVTSDSNSLEIVSGLWLPVEKDLANLTEIYPNEPLPRFKFLKQLSNPPPGVGP
jgi:hypothetical protein